MTELTREYVRSLFDYRGGELYWKVRLSHGIQVGDKAGVSRKDGYSRIGIGGKRYYNHRLVFLYHYGYLPNEIDHIDNDPTNNLIENLKDTTRSQNNMNSVKQKKYANKNVSSRYKGVSWDKERNKWMAKIGIDDKTIYLGRFANEMSAAKTYNEAAIELFGECAYLNEVIS